MVAAALCSLQCGGERGAETTATAPLFTQTVHAGVQSDVFLEVPASSRCDLHSEGLAAIELYADVRGVVSFFVTLEAAGVSADFSVSCQGPGPAHRHTTQTVRVSAVPDDEEPRAPTAWLAALAYPGRLVPALDEDPERVTAERLVELGLPAKPNRATAPEEYALWLEQVSQPSVEIESNLTDADFEELPPRVPIVNTIPQEQHPIWAGFVTTGYAGITSPLFDTVYGAWAVPSVADGADTGTFYSSIWVGLGGYPTDAHGANEAFPNGRVKGAG
ncbi:MAG TPA: hypothetical protein VLJ38_10695, partial [Polyangiaceae bacterium]|nr:hypothetical protein [Polyangiaceae bacterium]